MGLKVEVRLGRGGTEDPSGPQNLDSIKVWLKENGIQHDLVAERSFRKATITFRSPRDARNFEEALRDLLVT